jgi:radical SAM protein with 4Fe4S-binding SPASM domain
LTLLRLFTSKVGPDNTSFELQTNGVFSVETANWIANNIDMVWVSLDGPPDLHDAQRPFVNGQASSPIVLRNVDILLRGRCKVGIRPTITLRSLYRLREILEYASSLKVHALYYHYEMRAQGKKIKTTGSLYQIPLMEFAQQYLDNVVPFIPSDGMFVGNFLTINFDEESPYFCRVCLPCPQLTVDGYISACDKAPLGAAPRFSQMIFGKWNEKDHRIELYPDKIANLQNRRVENMIACKQCSIAYNCGGGCLGESNFLFNDIYKTIDEYCDAVKLLAAHLPRNTGKPFAFTHP